MTKQIPSARLKRAVPNPTTSLYLPVPPTRADAKAAVRSLVATGALSERAFEGTKAQVIARLAAMVSGPDAADSAGGELQQKAARAALEYVSSYGIKKARDLVPLDPRASPIATRLRAAQPEPVVKPTAFHAACDAARKGDAALALQHIAVELERKDLTQPEAAALAGLQATIDKHERVAAALEEMVLLEGVPPGGRQVNQDESVLMQLVACAVVAGELDQACDLVYRAQIPDTRAISRRYHDAERTVADRIEGASLSNVFPPSAGLAHVRYAVEIAERMLLRPFVRTRLLEDPVFLLLPDRIRALPPVDQERAWPKLIRLRMDLHQSAAATREAAALPAGPQRDGLLAEVEFATRADARSAEALEQLAILARGRGANPLADRRWISARSYRGGDQQATN